MSIQLSYNGTLYSYDNKTSTVVDQSGSIEVEIHPYESIDGATLYYRQGDTEGAVIISDNKANIPGLFLLTGSLSIGLKFPSSISNFVDIDVTRISSGGELLDDDIQFTLDNKKRLVLVPDSQSLLAIQHDNQSEAITFKFPRYQDSIDLSTKTPYVNYKRPESEDLGKSLCKITLVEDNYIQFVWVIGSIETEYTGIIQFQVEFTDFQGYRWQSQIGELPVLESLYNTGLESYEQGILEQYLQEFQKIFNQVSSIEGRVESLTETVIEKSNRVEELRESIEVDYSALHEAVENSKDSATKAKNSETVAIQKAQESLESAYKSQEWAEGNTEHSSKYWATVAQAEADRATIPAVEGVYNIVLSDRVTGDRYALIVEQGKLKLLEVSEELDTSYVILIDHTNGVSYELSVESGKIQIKEVN